MSDDDFTQYEMMYCDNMQCRVNTFERGVNEVCPGCESVGEPLPPRGGR